MSAGRQAGGQEPGWARPVPAGPLRPATRRADQHSGHVQYGTNNAHPNRPSTPPHTHSPAHTHTSASSMSVFESVLISVGTDRTKERLPMRTTPNPLPRPCSFSMALSRSSSLTGSARDPRRRCEGAGRGKGGWPEHGAGGRAGQGRAGQGQGRARGEESAPWLGWLAALGLAAWAAQAGEHPRTRTYSCTRDSSMKPPVMGRDVMHPSTTCTPSS